MMLVLVGPHEFGHMIVAKLCGVQVNDFSIGFGPALFKWNKGETQYCIRLIPLGGFCRMEGEDPAADERADGIPAEEKPYNPRAYNNKTDLQKVAILLAGVTMNVIIALVVTIIAVSIAGVATNTLESVQKNSPAAIAGIEAGDKIIEINGTKTSDWTGVLTELNRDPEKACDIIVARDGEELSYTVIPKYNEEEERYMVGIVTHTSRNPVKVIPYAAEYTWEIGKLMVQSIKMIFAGDVGVDEVSGPVGLVKVVDEAREYGATSYLLLLALVSLNLAFINLVPIPGLDGGKILFIILKKISFGRITDEMEMKATVCGALLLLGLFVLLTVNDISNLLN